MKNAQNPVHIVLLSGGSGSRLWPLSNNARSKQFLKVLRDEKGRHISMVQRVFAQIEKVPLPHDVTIATAATQQYSIESQIDGTYELVVEPERRDTAPAIMLACRHLADVQGAGANDTVVVMPIDTYANQTYYNTITALNEHICSGRADLVLLGVKPTYPSAKYGYILPKEQDGDCWPVKAFKEKPTENQAIDLIANGALWNCGVFAFKLSWLENITHTHSDARGFDELCVRYNELPKSSFDYEIVERTSSIAVTPYSGAWSDLGTWNTLAEEMADAVSGRVIGVHSTCNNTHVINELGIPMVVTDIDNSVVVATHDGILVASKEASSNMKPLVQRVAESRPMYERRRWGEYRVIDTGAYTDGKRALTKELVITAGKQLSYQRHKHRSEVWTIVSGTGEVVLDGEVHKVSPGDIIDIRPLQKHSALAMRDLHIIEVQLGELLEEEDIERFGDFWTNA